MRVEWDIARYLRSGRFKQVLGNYRTLWLGIRVDLVTLISDVAHAR